MTKEEILAAAGYPNTPQGIAAFYRDYPNPEDWFNNQQMAYGGMPNIMGIPFGAGVIMAHGGTPCYNCGGYSWVDDAISEVNKKKGGDVTQQGGNQDFLTQRNQYIKDLIKTNVEKNIRQEEAKKVKNTFIQMDSQLPPIGAPATMAYGGYYQVGGGPGSLRYREAYDQLNDNYEAKAMAADYAMNNLKANRNNAWGKFTGSFGSNSFDPSNFYEEGGGPNKDETWEEYQERLKEEKAGKEGGRGRIWDGTKWIPGKTTTQQSTTEVVNPWTNLAFGLSPEGQYSNWIPDNDIRTGYRLGKNDFKEMAKLNPNTKLTGIKLNYGPMGRMMPRLFGPKSITFGTMGKYEDNMRMKDVPGNDLMNFKKSTYGDGQGPYPETEQSDISPQLVPAGTIQTRPPLLPGSIAPPTFNIGKQEVMRMGGLKKFFVGGVDDPTPIDMNAEYMQPKNSFDLFNNYANAELEQSLKKTEDAGLRDPETNSSDVYKEYTAKKKTTGVGDAVLKRSALIADMISSGSEEKQSSAKERQKQMTYAMNRYKIKPADAIEEGDYTTAGGNEGLFRPDDYVPVQFPGYAMWGGFNTLAYGGMSTANSGLEVKMDAGLYGTNGNNQFNRNSRLEAGKISQKPTEVRDTLGPVDRDEANLEAEAGETAVLNMGGMPAHFKIGGKRHSEGGTPLNLPDNSFIFSDTAKMKIKDPTVLAQFGMRPKKGGYTPAEISSKYQINKFRKILADPNSESVERKTAEMMVANYNLKLAKLSMIQESMKGFPQGIPVIAMPYIETMEIDPSEFLPDQAQEQLADAAQPDADMGTARYGANVISQWPTYGYGGLSYAQEGTQTDDEPSFWGSVGHGVLNVLEAPQKAMMYVGTGLFGDREFEIKNPITGENKWVSEDNLPLFTKPNAKGEFWIPTGESTKAHYEMPGETLKRTYPKSSPVLQGALDIVADPLLISGIAKTGARMAVKKITEEAAEQSLKGTLKNTTMSKGIQSVLLGAGKKTTVKNVKIAEKAIDAAQAAVDAKKGAKAYTAARKAGAKELMKQDVKTVTKGAVKAAEKYLGKPVVEGIKKVGEGVKYVGEKTKELVKNIDVPSVGPLGVPLILSGARGLGNIALKEDISKAQTEINNLRRQIKSQGTSFKPSRTENKMGIFTNAATPGIEYVFDTSRMEYIPYNPEDYKKKDSVLVPNPAKKEAPADEGKATQADASMTETQYNWD